MRKSKIDALLQKEKEEAKLRQSLKQQKHRSKRKRKHKPKANVQKPNPKIYRKLAVGAGAFLLGIPQKKYKNRIYYSQTDKCLEWGSVFLDHLCELGLDLDYIIDKTRTSDKTPYDVGHRIAHGAINGQRIFFGHRIPIVQKEKWML